MRERERVFVFGREEKSVAAGASTSTPPSPRRKKNSKILSQVASKEFFLKMVPLFDGGDDVGMVLSPQCFHNLNPHADIFNHSNVHFWE